MTAPYAGLRGSRPRPGLRRGREKKRGLFSGATQVTGRRRGSLGVGRDPRLGRDRAQKPVMKGEARIRKNGDAIRSPAHTAAQSIVKIVLFRQDMVPSPFVEGLVQGSGNGAAISYAANGLP